MLVCISAGGDANMCGFLHADDANVKAGYSRAMTEKCIAAFRLPDLTERFRMEAVCESQMAVVKRHYHFPN
jgi:hypothetical protein